MGNDGYRKGRYERTYINLPFFVNRFRILGMDLAYLIDVLGA